MLFLSCAVVVAAIFLSLSAFTHAHPGEPEKKLTARQVEQLDAARKARHTITRNCDSAIIAFEVQRRAKRARLAKRQTLSTALSSSASATMSANTPTYTSVQNTTCVLTPEAGEGPYYIHGELFRTDIRDGMDGVPLLLDVGVMDVTTCTPLEDALVDIWNCNANGIYSGFISSETGGGGSGVTDQETFGRGAYPTDANGLVEFSTVFPGFYSGRSIHIHAAVLTNYIVNDNGTIGQEAGHIQHIGQIFFEESWSQLVVATEPYNTETIERTTNGIDRVYAAENSGGYNATAQLTYIGDVLSDGLLGYVTLGIDTSANYQISSMAYYSGENSK